MIKINIKRGVSLRGLAPQMAIAFTIIANVFLMYGYNCTITSGSDGRHGVGSRHHSGCGLDVRLKHLPNPKIAEGIVADIRKFLGPEFDVVWNKRKKICHVEYDPK